MKIIAQKGITNLYEDSKGFCIFWQANSPTRRIRKNESFSTLEELIEFTVNHGIMTKAEILTSMVLGKFNSHTNFMIAPGTRGDSIKR